MNSALQIFNLALLRNAYQRVRLLAVQHKFWTAIILIVVLFGGWRTYAAATAAPTAPRYMLTNVATGTVVAAVSEAGQVSTTDSINIEAQVSGNLTWVGVKAGDVVHKGQALMTIDYTSAAQAITDAKRQLAADELQYQQSSAQAPITYQNDVNALATNKEDLQDSYNTTYNDLSNTYLDLPGVMSSAEDIIFGYDLDQRKVQWNIDYLMNLFTTQQNTAAIAAFESAAKDEYKTALDSYNASLADYQQTTRTSNNDTLDNLLQKSIATETDVAQNLQTELNFLNSVSDAAQTYGITLPSKFSTLQTNTRSALSTANSDLATILSDKKTLDAGKQSIVSAQQTITLDKVGNPDGGNPISLQVSANSIAKEKEDLATQEENLADYTIMAPFDGTISSVSAHAGTSASGALATLVSKTQIAELSLNEVDAAKIKVGDKATLTFDAIDGLTLVGTVAEIDPVGTVSQGVVSYDVKVSFDAQNNQIKPGMTVNAAIQTGVAQNTLVVPSSAVKTLPDGSSYVLAFDPPLSTEGATVQGVLSNEAPQQIPVTIGLSDNTNVQILSGLSAGQQIVARTTSGTTISKATATPSTNGARGGNAQFGGGGGLRGATVVKGL